KARREEVGDLLLRNGRAARTSGQRRGLLEDRIRSARPGSAVVRAGGNGEQARQAEELRVAMKHGTSSVQVRAHGARHATSENVSLFSLVHDQRLKARIVM